MDFTASTLGGAVKAVLLPHLLGAYCPCCDPKKMNHDKINKGDLMKNQECILI